MIDSVRGLRNTGSMKSQHFRNHFSISGKDSQTDQEAAQKLEFTSTSERNHSVTGMIWLQYVSRSKFPFALILTHPFAMSKY